VIRGRPGFVDLAGGQGLLGQFDGRTTATVCAWLEQRSAEFRTWVQVAVIDPHAGYAGAVRELLPHAVFPASLALSDDLPTRGVWRAGLRRRPLASAPFLSPEESPDLAGGEPARCEPCASLDC
jgi:hypothetical protein